MRNKKLCFILFIFFLSLPPLSAQENHDYEDLVQRNLELRQKLHSLEEKYTALENERSVLIVHIRNLQQEKESLSRAAGVEGETHDAELKAAFGEVSKELSLVAKERDQLKKEFMRLREAQSKSEAAVQALEEEKAKLKHEISQIESTFKETRQESASVFGSLENEKAGLMDQMTRFKEAFEKEKEALLIQQEKAVEEAKAMALAESQEAAKALEEERIEFDEEKKNLRADKAQAVEEAQKKNRAVIKTLTEDKENLADEIVSLKKAMEQQKEDLSAQHREAVERAKQESDAVIKPLEREIEALTAKIGQIEAESRTVFDAVEEEKGKLLFELEELKKQSQEEKTALEGKWQASVAERQASEEKVQELAKQLAMEEGLYQAKEEELAARARALAVEQEDLKAGLLAMTQKNEVWAQKLKKMDEEKKRLEEKSLQAQAEVRTLRADFQKKEESWRKEANAVLVEKKELRKKAERLENARQTAQKASDEFKGKMESLERKVKDLEEGLKVKQVALKEYEALIRDLTTQNTNLQAKLAQVPPSRAKFTRWWGKKKRVPVPTDKQRLDMHFNLAVAYDKTGLYKQEEQEYLECLTIDPLDANVHYNLAVLYDDKLNDDAKAVEHYKKYMELRPAAEDIEKVKQWLFYAEEELHLGRSSR